LYYYSFTLPLAESITLPKKIAFINNFGPPARRPGKFGLSAIFIIRPLPKVFTITAAEFLIASRFLYYPTALQRFAAVIKRSGIWTLAFLHKYFIGLKQTHHFLIVPYASG
jgi:hypothetical protein